GGSWQRASVWPRLPLRQRTGDRPMKPASPSPWLLQLVKKPPKAKPPDPGASRTAPKSKRGIAYGQVALDREVQRLRSAPLHQRNNTLNRCAFRLGQLVATSYLGDTE